MTRAPIGIIGTVNIEALLGPLEAVPRPGKQAVVEHFEMRRAGSGPSVGLVLAALGMRPRLFGTVGDDDLGNSILHHLQMKGLDLAGVDAVRGQHTGICVSLSRRDGAHRYISSLGAVKATTLARLNRRRRTMEECDVILLTGYFVLPGLGFDGTLRLFKRLRQKGKTVAFDTGWDTSGWPTRTRNEVRELLRHVNIFLPNRDEARVLSGKRDPAAAARALQALGPQYVFVKLESLGALVATPSGVESHPGFPRNVSDTTAAGEAFNAGVLYGLCHGLKPAETLSFANATAALFLEAGDPEACTRSRVLALTGKRRIKEQLLDARRTKRG